MPAITIILTIATIVERMVTPSSVSCDAIKMGLTSLLFMFVVIVLKYYSDLERLQIRLISYTPFWTVKISHCQNLQLILVASAFDNFHFEWSNKFESTQMFNANMLNHQRKAKLESPFEQCVCGKREISLCASLKQRRKQCDCDFGFFFFEMDHCQVDSTCLPQTLLR